MRHLDCPQVSAAEIDSVLPGRVSLRWPSVPGVSRYTVEYHERGEAFGSGGWVDTLADTVCTIGVPPGRTYEFCVHAYCSASEDLGLPAIATAYVPDTILCPKVGTLRTQRLALNYATLVWDSVPEAQRYQLSVGPYQNGPDDNRIVPTTGYPHYATGLDTGIYYAAYIRAQCSHSCDHHDTLVWGPWSDAVYFYLGDREPDTTVAAVTAAPSLFDFGLTPNPAHAEVTVRVDEAQLPARLSLIDASGTVLLTQRLAQPETSLPLTKYPDGVYFVQLSNSKGQSTKKLVVK